ncbi:DUF1127 domain-containing protein [Thalassospiraceae bacterium LMO-JJ14]|nr:DUF1127 domain-containing protein [Thalassospiraceae bacterium LMO-JJ14]
MTNQINPTAGLPLFETSHDASSVNVQAILEQAKVMRGRVLGGMLSNAFAALMSAIRARRTAHTLDQLSDAVLADIGIERSQIASISRSLADGTYIQPTAEVTVLAPAEAAHKDDKQPELPLAA